MTKQTGPAVPRQPPKIPRPQPVPRVGLPEDIAARAGTAPAWPLIDDAGDGTWVVTFLWRDAEAREVLLFANRLTDETSLEDTFLEQVPGTDLWAAAFAMVADWRASYSFLVRRDGETAPWRGEGGQVAIRAALDRGQPDPRNADTCRNRVGVLQSVVSLPAAPQQPWLAPRDGVEAGQVTELSAPDGRRAWSYDPAGLPLTQRLPTLVVLDGEVWAGTQSLAVTLDNLISDAAVPPLRALLIDSGGREARWSELAADGAGLDYLAETALPWYAERRGVDAGNCVIAGQSLGGLTALRAGLLRPEVFTGVVSHSASLWQDDLIDDVVAGPGRGGRAHLSVLRDSGVGPVRSSPSSRLAVGRVGVRRQRGPGQRWARLRLVAWRNRRWPAVGVRACPSRR